MDVNGGGGGGLAVDVIMAKKILALKKINLWNTRLWHQQKAAIFQEATNRETVFYARSQQH